MTQRTDNQRIAKLEAALLEIAEIAEASEGGAAAFYGMLARKALTGNEARSIGDTDMINNANTFKGENGSFTGVYYKRSGEWFPGVQNNQTGKRVYQLAVRDGWSAASEAAELAESAAGKNAKMVLK